MIPQTDASIYGVSFRYLLKKETRLLSGFLRKRLVGRVGFEPTYTYVSRFTVCRL